MEFSRRASFGAAALGVASRPLAKPRGGAAVPHRQPLSDDFRAFAIGTNSDGAGETQFRNLTCKGL